MLSSIFHSEGVSIGFAFLCALFMVVLYVAIMGYKQKKFAASGAVGHVGMNTFVIVGCAILVTRVLVKLLDNEPPSLGFSDVVFLFIGIVAAGWSAVRSLTQHFVSALRKKDVGWEPTTENATE